MRNTKNRKNPLNKSGIKTWLRRNGFKPCGYGANWRNCINQGSFIKDDRLYRIRRDGDIWMMDVGLTKKAFGRWGDSLVYSVTFEFVRTGE